MDTKKTKSVPALERALKILEMLAASRTGLTLAESGAEFAAHPQPLVRPALMHLLWCHEWHVDLDLFDGSSMVADLVTTGFTLMRAGLEDVEAFTKLIIQNKPQRMLDGESAAAEKDSMHSDDSETNSIPSRFLGCVQAQPGEVEPPPPEKAVFYSSMFGWHPET